MKNLSHLSFFIIFTATTLLAEERPHPEKNPESRKMMNLGGDIGTNPSLIQYSALPKLKVEHAVISDVRDAGGTKVNQHAYLAHFNGKFWAMWSDGPGLARKGVSKSAHRNKVPGHDQPGTRVSFATSCDGLN